MMEADAALNKLRSKIRELEAGMKAEIRRLVMWKEYTCCCKTSATRGLILAREADKPSFQIAGCCTIPITSVLLTVKPANERMRITHVVCWVALPGYHHVWRGQT
jgi:hypothetical protein